MEDLELLFFDTFSHEASEEINLDLVQFPKPVYIGEVRIIPLGARVQADFPGGVRLGATNPSQFKIEFFVNDLSKPGASTFENLGIIDYNQNGNIHLECEHKVATDGLVLRGWYTTITLAVYGVLTKTAEPSVSQVSLQDTTSSQSQQPDWHHNPMRDDNFEGSHYMSYPSDSYQQDYSRYPWQPSQGCHGEYDGNKVSYDGETSWDERDDKSWNKETAELPYRSPEYRERGTPEYDGRRREYYGGSWEGWSKRPRTPPLQPGPPPAQPPPLPPTPLKEEGSCKGAQFEGLSPGDVESISEDDIPEEDGPQPFEPLSDDDLPDYPQFQDMDYDVTDSSEDFLKTFDPYTYEVQPPKFLVDPREEWTVKKEEKCVQLANLLSSVGNPRQDRQHWVETVEEVLLLLPSQISDSYIEEKLVEWMEFGLDFDEAMEQTEAVLKIRHIKSGIRLAEVVAQCPQGPKLVSKSNLHHRLLELYHKDHMAVSIKLMMLRCMDTALHDKRSIEELLSCSPGTKSAYQTLLLMLQENQLARLNFPLSAIITKIHFYHLLETLQLVVKKEKEGEKVNVEELSTQLGEICRILREATRLFSHPVRFLPVSALFHLPTTSSNPTLQLYNYFSFTNFIENCTHFLQRLQLSSPPVVVAICAIITELGRSFHGLKYLSFSPSVNPLVRSLFGANPSLALSLIYKLKALSCLDALTDSPEVDSVPTVDILHSLFCLTLIDNSAKQAVLHVLSMEDNIVPLLNILRQKAASKKRSPTRGYVTDLILMVVKYSPMVEYLTKYASDIMELSNGEFSELAEISSWLKPYLSPSPLTYDNCSSLYDFIKDNIENCTNLPGEMVTTIKLFKWFGISPDERCVSNSTEFKELKYKFVMLKIYSLGGLSDFVIILQKLCDHYEQPVHSAELMGKQGAVMLAFVLPCLQLIRRMLVYIIQCRNTDFKDLTAIPILLKMYNILLTLPVNCHAHEDVEQACHEIIESLLAYTQVNEEEALTKSLWTLMIQEAVKWMVELPMNFLNGLVLLSELLPLPLPMFTKRELGQEECDQVVNWRKLWSAHWHAAGGCLEEAISVLCGSGHQPLVEALRRVCLQLADLAAPTAVMVVRTLLDAVADSHREADQPRILSFLGTLTSHPPVKAALLHLLLRDNPKIEDKYFNLFTSLFDRIDCLEGLLSVVQPLCYIEICMSGPPPTVPSDSYLASALPPKDLLVHSCTAMVNHLVSAQSSPATVIPILRIFCLLVEHDYGLFHTSQCLQKGGSDGSLGTVVEKYLETKEVADWAVALGLALGSAAGFPLRTTALSHTDLVSLFGSVSETHPLHTLANKESVEDESRKLQQKNVESLIKLLKGEDTKMEEDKELVEPLLGTAEPVLKQFSSRPVFVQSEAVDFDRLSPSFWLSPPQHREFIEPDKHQIMVDLSEVAKSELGEWADALNEICAKRHSSQELRTDATLQPPASLTKPTFVGPVRGRGVGSGGVGGGADVFRSRPPNTSRPPSLHVDDFVALETCGAQPTGPTGYNQLTMRAHQDLVGMRNAAAAAARGRGVPDGGIRFFGQSYLALHHFQYYHHHF